VVDMEVIKKDGRIEEFNKKKIEAALLRCGEKKYAKKIANEIEKKLKGIKKVQSSLIREYVIKELQKTNEESLKNFISFQKTIRKLSKQEDYLENRLRDLVGEFGIVEGVYGGFRITVKKPEKFDYFGVFSEILKNSNLSVSLELKDGYIIIYAK